MSTGPLVHANGANIRHNGKSSFFSLSCPEPDSNADELSSLVVFALSERAQFTVWSGDLVKGDRVLFQISLRSFFPPFLPHRL